MHEEPAVPNLGKPHTGTFLREGVCIAIEPMINLGKSRKAKIGADTWTAITGDKKPSAHFEHTVVVRKNKAEVLTLSRLKKNSLLSPEIEVAIS
jgi:methionyl aminopeptidase